MVQAVGPTYEAVRCSGYGPCSATDLCSPVVQRKTMKASVSAVLALVCVLAISFGQVLFKVVGNQTRNGITLRSLATLGAAGVLYVGATLLWILILRFNPLHRVYSYMALSFVIVPIVSWFVFKEHLSMRYIAGSIIVIVGLIVAIGG